MALPNVEVAVPVLQLKTVLLGVGLFVRAVEQSLFCVTVMKSYVIDYKAFEHSMHIGSVQPATTFVNALSEKGEAPAVDNLPAV